MVTALQSELPIQPYLETITSTLSASRCLILQAEPGAGKSTAVPLQLLQADWLGQKKIIMLEPRRVMLCDCRKEAPMERLLEDR